MKEFFWIIFVYTSCIGVMNECSGQSLYYGADMSYVNEMESCGVVYTDNMIAKDPYALFNEYGGNLVRLRLWHTPSWYDDLNDGQRYSDLKDVKKAIQRAKAQGLNVLLDFHLSDNWADPSKQLVPAAWLPIVDNTNVLKDSLYNYVHSTLTALSNENLLPEMVQIGNETNKGILLSPEDNNAWTLDWTRNAILFNSAIQAINDINIAQGADIQKVLHLADPANAEWLIDGFVDNGVTDFDIIGMSYYWAWHLPTSISETGEIIETLKELYPEKEVLIVETGYIWTTASNDEANNIISSTHPDYHPASPVNQRDWLIDLMQEVIQSDGIGVIYWEPFWVSSPCNTQWGQGSHQEHATFFDFENNVLVPGGIEWMSYDYDVSTQVNETDKKHEVQILSNSVLGEIIVKQRSIPLQKYQVSIADVTGKSVMNSEFNTAVITLSLEELPAGIYIVSVLLNNRAIKSKKLIFHHK
ncbi:MAG: glycosyl hydrolase 53 family protein [Saprospiraceae bacterium]|nr:glycosyl hydrolase 53 family protein [Saprospiraceae bacterium]